MKDKLKQDISYMDTSLAPEERAKLLLAELSVGEKVAQLCGIWMQQADEPGRLDFGIGQVSTLEMRRKKSLRECVEWQIEVQKKIVEKSPHHIPAIFHMEGLCGAFIQDAASFPSGIGRGSSFDPQLEETIGQIAGRQERAVGITQTLAPVLDVAHDPRMGRYGESYGEDPALASAMGAAFTRGLQGTNADNRRTDACAKHFMGFHHSQGGIHGADVSISERELVEKYGKPFQAAIAESGLRGVMPCYCTVGGEAVSSSRRLLQEVLRKEMGFDGVVLSDYGAISNQHRFQGLYEDPAQAGYESLKAGMDVELPMPEAFNQDFINRFSDGTYDMRCLDRAVERVLAAKFRMGLFEDPYAYTGEKLQGEFYRETDRGVSLRSARESMVLLKNDGTLPMRADVRKVVVVGCQADNARMFFGGYTHLSMSEALYAAANAMAGVQTEQEAVSEGCKLIPGTQIQSDEMEEMDALLREQKPHCKSLYRELAERLPQTEVVYAYGYPIAGGDCSRHEEALAAMQGADLVLFMLGGKHGSCSVSSMGEGVDGTDINLPPCQELLLEKAAGLGIPMVGIHMNGRPVSSDTADTVLNAILEAWNPSEMGAQAIADTLLGINNPSGRLPVSVAYNAGQLPIFYNHRNGSCWNQGDSIGFRDYVDLTHRPRYCFGHGLSYTTFAYSDLHVAKTSVSPDEEIELSFALKNTGEREGTEVVQIYVRDVRASMVRPVKELAGFLRVSLLPGETKRVEARIAPSQLAFLDKEMRWLVEKGSFELMVGSSSEDIRLKTSVTVGESKVVVGAERRFYAAVSADGK